MLKETPDAWDVTEVASMVNALIPDRPARRSVDSGLPCLPAYLLGKLFYAKGLTFRKLSEFKKNSIGIQIAFQNTVEARRLSVGILNTNGSQKDTNLNSESYLVSFAN